MVEVLRHLAATLEAQGAGALRAEQLRKAATQRLFGFEILTAPFVVAHLQLGLALREANAALAPEQRAAVYLTNALTGWDTVQHEKQLRVALLELQQEAEAARHVKRDERIVVIIGNPPYDGYAGLNAVGSEEERLADAYRHPRRTAPPQGQGLNDLYVRFFRMAERQIAERTRQGLVCFVANYSWLDGLSHPGLRERFLEAFDHIWIDNLNGDKYATGKTTPDGRPDPSVFSTPFNREGIQVGAAVALLVRATEAPADPPSDAVVRYRDFWGKDKRAELAAIADQPEHTTGPVYETLLPNPALGLPFKPRAVEPEYLTWPTLPEVFPIYYPGVQTKRDEFVTDIDLSKLQERIRRYFDSTVSDEQMRQIAPRAMEETAAFNPTTTRRRLQARGELTQNYIPFLYRPLDVRWLYWEPDTNLLERKSPDFYAQSFEGNLWFASQHMPRREWSLPQYASEIGSLDIMDRGASFFPLYLAPDLYSNGQRRENLSNLAQDYLATVGSDAETLFYHALAVLHAPAYRDANAGALRQDWPRLPLPSTLATLLTSATLGRQVAALLDVRRPVPGVTHSAIAPELRQLGAPQRRPDAPDDQLHPAEGHFGLRAQWGTRSGGTVLPGKGRTTPTPGLEGTHLNVWLNEEAYWAAVPTTVWTITLGGYPVLKKWLSYRAASVLARDLTADEIQEFTRLVRRLAALTALSSALDVAYAASAGANLL